ncbi:phosphopantetheine-binding protein, partial [Streptomyces sp. NPDC001920]
TQGLPATSIAWGLWQHTSNLTAHLHTTDRERMARSSIEAMPTEHALALFDAALDEGRPLLVAARMAPAVLRDHAKAGTLQPVLRGLVRGASARRVADAGGEDASAAEQWARRLAGRTATEQLDTLVELVRSHAAAVLGHGAPTAVTDELAFKEAGFDSLTAVELRNRLGAAVGLRLPATVVFDHPTPRSLGEFLRGELAPSEASVQHMLIAEIERVEAAVLSGAPDDGTRGRIAARLQDFLFKIGEFGDSASAPGPDAETSSDVTGKISTASDEEIFDFIDNEL